MNPIKGAGKITQFTCSEVALPEFPQLLFGNHSDGSRYFDATFYLFTVTEIFLSGKKKALLCSLSL